MIKSFSIFNLFVSLSSLKEDNVFFQRLVLLVTDKSNVTAKALVGPNVDVVIVIDPNLFIRNQR